MMKPKWLWLCVFIIGLIPAAIQAQGNQAEAQRRIQAAIGQQSLELDLSGLGLTEVPPDISSLSQLQVLNLSNNRLQTLPLEIGDLANLQMLNLSANPLGDLSPETGRLTALQTLDLSHTSINQFPPPVLKLANLYWLNLGHTAVSQLPPEIITSLTRLKWLDVPYTPISQLPPELGQLTDLAWLDLSYTAVSELPITLVDLAGLRTLVVDGTPWAEQNPVIAGGTASQIQAYLRDPNAPAVVFERDEPVTIKWYVGLGTGTSEEQLKVEEKIVEAFNNSQDDIILELMCVCFGSTAHDWLTTSYASGQSLDIIGPIGFAGANGFTESDWLDLQPLADAFDYDFSQFPPNIIESYRTPDGELSALPFAAYPGVLFYNADLFDAAGLNYPPTVPNEPYIMPDGSSVPWDYETVALIGSLLTVDSNGHDATHPDFDPADIVQFGFANQWDSMRSNFHTFGSAELVNETGQLVIPEHWRAQARWLWDGIWEDHFIPNNAQLTGERLNGNPFASGHVAMARSMAWYTCCLDDLDARWDIALQPAYDGTIYAPMDFDSFYIHKSTQYPQESFVVLQYLLGAAAPELLEAYGAFPARPDLQEATLNQYQQRYPSVQNWDVFLTSMQFAPAIHHESVHPNYNAGVGRFSTFLAMLRGEDGANIDLDIELDTLQSDLQLLVDRGLSQQKCDRSPKISEAQSLIQDAIDQQATSLDLSGLQLTQIPGELWQVAQLESLDLSDNPLCTLSSDIGLLTNLKTLDLSHTGLSQLSPAIGQLSTLEMLNLHDTTIRFLPRSIGNLSNLRTLDLSVSHLQQLPPEIAGLVSLELLDLSTTQITKLPPEIGRLANLRSLDLNYSNMRITLPPEIGRLSNLQELNLSNNDFAEFPPEIGHLSGLHTLNLRNNSDKPSSDPTLPEQVPPELGYLTGLRSLSLATTTWGNKHRDVDKENIAAVQTYLRNTRNPNYVEVVRPEPVTINWFMGLGTGTSYEQIQVQERIEAEFNASQDAIILDFICICTNGTPPPDTLRELIEKDVQVDIIGPIGFAGAENFKQYAQIEWLDLQPLVESHSYDLSQFPPNMVESYRTPDGELPALPFLAYPSVLYYNADLFDAAGLNYPPTVPGEAYIMPDGSQLPWDYETVALIGRLLTLDTSGRNTTHPNFDPNNRVQFGFVYQWNTIYSDFHTFEDAPFFDENGQVVIWDNWRAQARWVWDGIWKDHFIPSAGYWWDNQSANSAFTSGQVAMAQAKVWYLCCLHELDAHWDIALPPAYNGTIYAPMDFDSFYIHKATKHPEESFIVLQYLLGEAAPDLLETYGGFPARPDLQAAAIARYRERYPDVQNWDVFTTATQFIPAIHHETPHPNFARGQSFLRDFPWILSGDDGATIDVDAELDKLQSHLQAIIDGEDRP